MNEVIKISQEESYTTDDIARLLKVSKLTVYDLIKKGDLPAYRVGRQMRVDANDLERYKSRGKAIKPVIEGEKTNTDQVVISGQDISLDMLARKLENKNEGFRPLRSYVGSLDSLIAMYEGRADIVSTHLLEGSTGEYNIPYIKKLLVSKPFIVLQFITRKAGLYVARGNPHHITGWEDLKDPKNKLINRESGAGARVLLDEQLRMHGIRPVEVNGYEDEQTSHFTVASTIQNERADVGVGIEQTAKTVGVDFIPLITERYDLVMLQTPKNKDLVENVIGILNNKEFQEELNSVGYNVEEMGTVLWKQ